MYHLRTLVPGPFVLYILVLSGLADAQVPEPGFVSLFDGKTLNGWKLVGGKGTGYLVEGGLLVCPADGGGNLFTEKEYGNFILRFEFKLTPGANNGIGIRAPLDGRASYQGMEIQILDDGAPRYQGRLRPAQYHGSIYDVVPARQGFQKPVGEWNDEEIRADGRHIQVLLNGHQIVDADLDRVTDPEVLKRHPGLQRAHGHLGFLGHSTRVEFRNIRLKEL
jgi:3-keto-disaccharide hydrolase